jgi:predicted RNA binding protein YcfA (HicA-like mRNA interferase family)
LARVCTEKGTDLFSWIFPEPELYFLNFWDVGLTYLDLLCIIHNMKSKEIIKLLLENGWILRGVKGSHHIYTHPAKKGHISVPHPKNDLGAGMVHKLLKQAGLK